MKFTLDERPKNDAGTDLAAEGAFNLKKKRTKIQYRALLDAAPDSLVVIDQLGKIVFVNAQAEKLFGYRREELIGKSAEPLISERSRGKHDEQGSPFLSVVPERSAMAALELFGVRKDGSEFPAEIRLSPLKTRGGTLVSGAIRDLSERRRTEEDLRRLASIVSSSDDAIIGKTLEGIITSWNLGAERMYGYSATEAIGKPVSMLVPSGHSDEIPGILERLKRGETIEHYQTVRLRKDGNLIDVEISASPIRDAMESIVGASTIAHDISLRIASERLLVRTENNRRLATEALRQSEERYRILLDGIEDHAIFMMDSLGKVVSWNAGAERIKGYKAKEIIGQNFSCFFPAQDIKNGRPEEVLRITAERGKHEERSMRVRKDGTRFLASVSFAALRDSAGNLQGFSEFSHDLSASRESEARYRGLLEAAPDAMVVVNPSGDIVLLNIQAEMQFGYRRDELVGQNVKIIIPEGFAERLVSDSARFAEGMPRQQIGMGIELIGRRKDGSSFPIELMLSPLKNAEGILITAAIRNVSVARAMSLQITHLAEHDFLTGLPNRMLFKDRVSQAIALGSRHMKKVAVLFLDLDGFKHINDSLGHPIGDQLLQSIGQRLVSCVRESDTVSRQGGDEFVVLLSEMNEAADAGITSSRMLKAVAEPHNIDQHDLHVTASIGVSVYPDDGLDAEALIKNADTAMYQAKENGRHSYQFFTSAMNVRAVERQSIEENLRRALEHNELFLQYQPRIDLRSGRIVGAEALVRWTHPVRGLVSPAEFVPIAEDCGLILPVGRWVLREACRQAQAWLNAGLSIGTVAVNISSIEFRDDDFLGGVFAVLDEAGLDPQFLELELTETVLMKQAESAAATLKILRARGVKIAVDDFGTGYSSLSYLQKFPIDALKIDQSFVRRITSTLDDVSIVTAIIGMARSLNLRVVAEGVETEEARLFLKAHQCDEAQGYLFSRPVSAELFAELLKCGIAETSQVKG